MVELGERDSSRSQQPYVAVPRRQYRIILRVVTVDFAELQVDPNPGTFSVRAHNAQSRACGAPAPVYKGKDIARRSGGAP